MNGKRSILDCRKQIFLTILLLSPIATYFISSFIEYNTDPNEHRPWISWYDDPSHKVYVSWETKSESIGTVYYGESPLSMIEGNTESMPTSIHHLNITGLNPDTLYFYEIKIEGQSFATGQFRTAPLDINTPFTFVMSSDTQQPVISAGGHKRLAKTIENKNYSFLSLVGDYVNDGNSKSNWNNFFSIASIYTDTIPLAPVIGNHDMYGGGTWWFQYFINNVNKTSTSRHPNGQFFYSFNWSSVHFIMCHFAYGRSVDFTQGQMDWLIQDLSNSQSMPFRVMMFHCPITGAGFFGYNDYLYNNLLPIVKAYNVSALVGGHMHHFERGLFENDIHEGRNIPYFILGGGGGMFEVGLRPKPESIIITPTPSYTEVEATATTLTFRTLTLENNIIDEFILEAF